MVSASTSTEVPSAHSRSETKAAGMPPAIPVASSVASLTRSLSVKAMAPSRFATALYASGIYRMVLNCASRRGLRNAGQSGLTLVPLPPAQSDASARMSSCG